MRHVCQLPTEMCALNTQQTAPLLVGHLVKLHRAPEQHVKQRSQVQRALESATRLTGASVLGTTSGPSAAVVTSCLKTLVLPSRQEGSHAHHTIEARTFLVGASRAKISSEVDGLHDAAEVGTSERSTVVHQAAALRAFEPGATSSLLVLPPVQSSPCREWS